MEISLGWERASTQGNFLPRLHGDSFCLRRHGHSRANALQAVDHNFISRDQARANDALPINQWSEASPGGRQQY